MAWQPPPQRPQGPQDGGYGGAQPPHQPPAAPQKQQQTTLYQLLNVDQNAHPTIIRYAYRFLGGMYHPDNAEFGNTEMFRVVTDAFRTLSDAGKRAAYDAQLGVTAPPPSQTGGAGGGFSATGLHNIPKTGVSYNEVEMRLAVLQILLTARKKRTQTGGASAKMMMDIFGLEMAEMEFVLWYMREKGLILRAESMFQITVMGVDYLVDSLARTQVIDNGRKGPNLADIQLPATIG